MIKYGIHIYYALRNSIFGIRYSMSEKAVRMEVLIGFFIFPLTFYFIKGKVEVAIIIISYLIVLITELLNTAVEKTVDRISYKKHILSKKAKDIGSAAVFLSILNLFLVFLIILFF